MALQTHGDQTIEFSEVLFIWRLELLLLSVSKQLADGCCSKLRIHCAD
jgi:hypothetical protein